MQPPDPIPGGVAPTRPRAMRATGRACAALVALVAVVGRSDDVAPRALSAGATDVLVRALEPLPAAAPGSGQPAVAGPYTRPLSLVESLERSGDRSRRLWISQAYWKVSAGFAMFRWTAEALARMDLIPPGSDPHDRAELDVALAAARADLADARAELVAVQQELADLIRLPPGEPLPWTVDRPLAAAYQTHFESIFSSRPATGRIRAIVRMLPSKHEALEARAAAVLAAQKAMQMAEADHAKGQRPIEAVTVAHAAVIGQQREFVKVLKAYNLDIAEYAMAVADLSMPDDRFVSMLIGTPIQTRPAPPAGAVADPPGN
ncbi:MAG: hypothetical protein ACKOTB_18820 [Planctomycetia bacterium]